MTLFKCSRDINFCFYEFYVKYSQKNINLIIRNLNNKKIFLKNINLNFFFNWDQKYVREFK